MTTRPASATVLEPMTIAHSTRDLVSSILHAHASILHAPVPPLTTAELDEARSIVSQLLDGAGPPKPGRLPPALRTPRPLPASPSSVSSSPVPRTVQPPSSRSEQNAPRKSSEMTWSAVIGGGVDA